MRFETMEDVLTATRSASNAQEEVDAIGDDGCAGRKI